MDTSFRRKRAQKTCALVRYISRGRTPVEGHRCRKRIGSTVVAAFVLRAAKFDRRSGGDVYAPAFSLYLSQLVQPEDNVPKLFLVESGLGLDVGKTGPLLEIRDGLQHRVGGRGAFSGLATLLRRTAPTSCPGAFNLGFQTIDLGQELFNIPFRRNLVMVKKKFHHRIKTDGFSLFSSHAFLLGVLSRSECDKYASAFFENKKKVKKSQEYRINF
ncbi:MAG: hypothetical protein PVG78_09165 [Desulfobacterales bacterium]